MKKVDLVLCVATQGEKSKQLTNVCAFVDHYIAESLSVPVICRSGTGLLLSLGTVVLSMEDTGRAKAY